MSRSLIALLFTAVALLFVLPLAPAVAADQFCSAWSTAKVEREEGRQWTASICARRKDRDASLEIVCFGGKWNIRYLPVLPDDLAPTDGTGDFVFQTSSHQSHVGLGYEGLAGAFATVLDRRHPLFEMIMSGDELSIIDTKSKVATQSYTLSNSRQALTKLGAKCRR
jgi:hypothetical protein